MHADQNAQLLEKGMPQARGVRLIHRLLMARHGIPRHAALNTAIEPAVQASPIPMGADLLRITNALKAEAFGPQGRRVDYSRLRNSETYVEYRRCAARLRTMDPASLGERAAQLAFWINLYNALIVDAVIQLGVRKSVNDIPGFFWKAAYIISGQRFSAFDIEYGILRANAPHPAIPGSHFGRRDPRRAHSLEDRDARVHFALVCAARSCPPISVYEPEQIDRQLTLATRAFINGGGVIIDHAAREVRLSKIFQWYAPDFGAHPLGLGNKRPFLNFIAPYLVNEHDRQLVAQGGVRVSFQPYDWKLNI